MEVSGQGESAQVSVPARLSQHKDACKRCSTADYRNLSMAALAKTRARCAGVAPRALNPGDGRLSPLDHASP